MRIALLSNVTVEVLAGMLKNEHDLWMPPGFGAWMETALSVPEGLKEFGPEAVFLLLDFHHCPPPPNFSTSLETAVASLESALPNTTVIVPDLEDLALELEESQLQNPVDANFCSRPIWTKTPLLTRSEDRVYESRVVLQLPQEKVGGESRWTEEKVGGESRWTEEKVDGESRWTEEKVGGESRWTKDDNSTVHLHLISPPQSPFYDERMWKLGSMPWSLKGLRAIQGEINRLVRAMKGERKKVLALDFDNTLWRGVIGEDGVEGVEPLVDFQREIAALRARGVLLVGLSKNNAADVEPVWDDPRMVLKKEDFVDLRVDWNDKPANLTASAKALNLGSDSFVFVDDNPAERAQMAALHPEVVVPDWPVSIRRLARLYFPRLRVTDEDRQKTAQYQAEAKRKELAASLSVEDYLKSLEIRTEIHPIVESEFPRVAQLSQKTNQFNVCTNRYTVDDIARFAADPTHLLVTLHAGDKFGDQGLVAFVHAREVEKTGGGGENLENIHCPPPPPTSTYAILDWVMSCRVMNRRIEFTMERSVEDLLKRRGVTKLTATWRKTAKNAPVRDLFEQFGFEVTSETETEKKYERGW